MLAVDLREYDQVTVDLTGYNRYGRSFLDEGFGALIRKSGFIKAELDKKLIYKHDHLTSVITIIDERIREAEADRLARL
ncbi:Putative uncharacterized protein [Moritella viscosa]|uniref:DUF4325 domain-containing protein n=2 Tax=Moritella viscosa TaxID=80854 RepID=A0A1K9ZGJ1_9GAMM|nr:Putative uncharacterized protein [Moritella viscosa]